MKTLPGPFLDLSKVEEMLSILTDEKVFIHETLQYKSLFQYFTFIFSYILGCPCRYECSEGQKRSSAHMELRWLWAIWCGCWKPSLWTSAGAVWALMAERSLYLPWQNLKKTFISMHKNDEKLGISRHLAHIFPEYKWNPRMRLCKREDDFSGLGILKRKTSNNINFPIEYLKGKVIYIF